MPIIGRGRTLPSMVPPILAPVRVALVVDEVRRVLVGRPLHDPRLPLLTLQGQRPLVAPERLELARRLRRVLLPLAQPPSGRWLRSCTSTTT